MFRIPPLRFVRGKQYQPAAAAGQQPHDVAAGDNAGAGVAAANEAAMAPAPRDPLEGSAFPNN
jgi:hypothetical protein